MQWQPQGQAVHVFSVHARPAKQMMAIASGMNGRGVAFSIHVDGRANDVVQMPAGRLCDEDGGCIRMSACAHCTRLMA
jgi:hypothetical protein